MKCKTCIHYGIYKMVMSGGHHYAGDIPCLRCVHYGKNDEYELQGGNQALGK
jgi:hypothetical protein